MDIMCEVNPKYEKFVIYDKGEKGTLCAYIEGDIWNDRQCSSMV